MATDFDNPQTTAEKFFSSSSPEDVAGSDDLVSTLIDEDKAVPAAQAAASDGGSPDGTYVVKKGDNLTKISQELQIPLKDFATYNGITDVKLPIFPGTKYKYLATQTQPPVATQTQAPTAEKTFSGAAGEVNEIIGDKVQSAISYIQDKLSLKNVTDLLSDSVYLSAFLQTKGLIPDKANTELIQKTLTDTKAAIKETATDAKTTIKAIQADDRSLSSQAFGLKGEQETIIEPESNLATLEPAIEKNAQVVPVVSETGASESNATQEKLDKLPPDEAKLAQLIKDAIPIERPASEVYTEIIKKLGDQDFTSTVDAKELYQQLSDDVARDTKKIDDSIAAIAKEEIRPTFKGFDKFLAVLGAALGSYGSSITGTPNFALNIINKAIDADAQQFLASQEIRTKSLLEQRQAVLQRRTDLLQLGINQANRTLKATQGQRDNLLKSAEVQKIIDDVTAAQDEALQQYKFGLVELYSDRILKQKLADNANSKLELVSDEKARTRQVKLPGSQIGIFGPTMSDKQIDKAQPDIQKFFMGHGKLVGNSGAAQVLRETGGNADSIELAEKGIIGKLIELVEKEPVASKIGFTETGKKVKSLHTKLKNHYQKEIMGAGANLTGVEVEQVEKIVGDPTAGDILFGTYLIGLRNLQNQLESQYANIIDIKDIKVSGEKIEKTELPAGMQKGNNDKKY